METRSPSIFSGWVVHTNNIDNIIKEKSKQNFKIISQLNQKSIDISFPLKFKNPKRTKERSNTGTYLLKYIFKMYNNSNIYLFGFDMCMPENRKNFHNDYNEKFTDEQKHGHYLYISRLIKENKTNNQIYSCSNISRLNELLEYKFPDGF
jgi:hypothetical protein